MKFSTLSKLLNTLRYNSLNIISIARQLEQRHNDTCYQIKLLEEKGIIKKEVNPKNNREKIVSLTEKGNKLSDYLCGVNKLTDVIM